MATETEPIITEEETTQKTQTVNKETANVAPISETWKVKGFPQFFRTGHVKNIMETLELDTIDVFKKTPNVCAYIRFKSLDEKLRAESIINSYTTKKIKRLHCIEHPNRKQYEV